MISDCSPMPTIRERESSLFQISLITIRCNNDMRYFLVHAWYLHAYMMSLKLDITHNHVTYISTTEERILHHQK